ncbi:MAG: 1-deoxy-D-xylulose-5-phosphate synthase, partial [Spirochaetes bacterium]|nr:1-deoxy-D-xylulose-5-phosphate synthase [Spirochaetota bacterium]
QCYSHKILTGRLEKFSTIRKENGLSGFTRRTESKHDHVDAGHSSTSISQAVGFAVANRLQGKNDKVIAVIGDGSLTGGVAFEGLNYTGHVDYPLLVILNDNDMSISKNVGAVSNYISKFQVTKFYQFNKHAFEERMKKGPWLIRTILTLIYKLKRGFKFLVEYENVFTNLGFEYIGPIDGHEVKELINFLRKVKKNVHQPVLLHIKTVKGKGFDQAEGDPTAFHGVTPYLMTNGKNGITGKRTFTDVFSEKICQLGEKYHDLVTITAAMESGTGLAKFNQKFPDRFFDVGIAEQHAMSFCSTIAYQGLKPVFAVYSTFLMRALDQLCQDVCISQAPVILAIDRAGVVGADGETHQGQFDISFLRMLPNLMILAPCDATELRTMLEFAYHQPQPVAIRYPRDVALESQIEGEQFNLQSHPVITLKEGKDLQIFVIGPFVDIARSAVDQLKMDNIDSGISLIRMIKPFPQQEILDIVSKTRSVLVIEENVQSGSVAETIGMLISENQLSLRFSSINLPDCFIEHDNRKNILQKLGFTAENIYQQACNLLDKKPIQIK